jgi:hypothetical protein
MNTGRFYEYHSRLHPGGGFGPRSAQGMPLPGRRGWRAANVSPPLQPYGRIGYLWHGSPTPLKLAAGGVAVGVAYGAYELFDYDNE